VTHYELLQVSPNASQEVIDAAWKAQLRIYHPDNGKRPNAEKARTLNEAHDLLSDPKKRAEYNQTLLMNGHRERSGRRNSRTAQEPRHAYEPAYGKHSQQSYAEVEPTAGELVDAAIEHALNGGEVNIQELLVRVNELIIHRIRAKNPLLDALLNMGRRG